MKERVAIVGTGVAGLGCAWQLRNHADITLFEQDSRPGGHTNTVTVCEGGRFVPIDTGFIVFNKVTYPNLCQLFDELGVTIKPSEMSFSVQHLPTGLEYNGMGLNKLFAQRRNITNLRFHALILQIFRFFRIGNKLLASGGAEALTLGEFVRKHGLGQDFLDLYLVPMSSAVWSTHPNDVLDFPAATLLNFFRNHGFLGVSTHHQWYTVDGGARTYVEKILSAVPAARLTAKVTGVRESAGSAEVTLATGERQVFDRVILASHADQTLSVLENPDADQRRLLGAFRYQRNPAILHTDASVMPRKRLAWASWNYTVDSPGSERKARVHYWMNALQGVSQDQDYFVSLHADDQVDRSKVLYETTYDHPVFTVEAMRAQAELPKLNTRSPGQRIFFCGSYFRYGFHEDAYKSAVDLATVLRLHLAQ
ncbi:NADP transhydrogenase subunit alpha [Spartobacteria bacterium LR76]|nr:NADP transhydrogenase subunit alpha [Spartobacteria bacterium LR76]